MSSIADSTFTNVFDDARADLSDVAKDVYTDAVLLPHGVRCYFEIQDEFAKRDLTLLETITTSLTYAADASTIVIPGSITNLYAPLEIWERDTTAENWQELKRTNHLGPDPAQARDRLHFYEWSEGSIKVNPATKTKLILCRYQRQLARPAAATKIGFEGIFSPLTLGTAWRAAKSKSRTDLDILGMRGDYYKAIKDSIMIATRQLQSESVRQEPYRKAGVSPVIIHSTN